MKRLWLSLCLLLLAAQPALAETRSLGYAIWNVNRGNVQVLYILPEGEAKNLAVAGSPVLTTKQIADYLLKHLAVFRQGKACSVTDQGQGVGLINTLAFTPGFLRFEILFGCQDGVGLTLSDTAFSDSAPHHLDYARVQIDNGGFVQHVFSAAAPRFALPGAGETPRSDSLTRYAALGFSHVFRSIEILCFMLALLLVAARRRDYLLTLGALAAGYGVAGLISVFDLGALRFAPTQPFVGLLVSLAAATSVALSLADPRRAGLVLGAGSLAVAAAAAIFRGPAAGLAVMGAMAFAVSILFLRRRRDRSAIFLVAAAFLFAVLDGFVLPGDLAVLSLPPGQLAPMLLGFDGGALLGEVVLPLFLMALWFWLPRVRGLTAPGGLLSDVAASGFIGCGIFWFGTWLYS